MRILFISIRSISGVDFCFFSPEAIIPEEFLSSHSSYRYPIIPVLRSSVLKSARDLFVLLHLNPLKHIGSSNSSRRFFLFLFVPFHFLLWFIQDSFSLIIILILSFFSILPVVHEDLLKFAICHFSILFKKNK